MLSLQILIVSLIVLIAHVFVAIANYLRASRVQVLMISLGPCMDRDYTGPLKESRYGPSMR